MADKPTPAPSTLAEHLAVWISSRKTKDLMAAIPDPALRATIEQIVKEIPAPTTITALVANAENGLTALDNRAGAHSRKFVLATLLSIAGLGTWWMAKPTQSATAPAEGRPSSTEKPPPAGQTATPTLAAVRVNPQSNEKQFLLGRYSKICVVAPPTQGVTINGNLDDWNHAGKFRTEVVSASSEGRYVEGMMMADKDNLYIGAHIGDPNPMKGTVPFVEDKKVDPGAWNGGCVQVRLNRGDGIADPNSDAVVHIDLWHFATSESRDNGARLRLAHGMDYHIANNYDQNDPPFQGRFSPDTDGRGYVLEYAIPWKLLFNNADSLQPPTGEHRATWNVFWSNPEGKEWQFKLVEVFNDIEPPNEGASPSTYLDLKTWGTAQFLPPDK